MPSPNQREVGISPKVDTGIQKEKEKEKEKEKVRRKVEKEMESQERARAKVKARALPKVMEQRAKEKEKEKEKAPQQDVGIAAVHIMHRIAPLENQRAKERPRTPTGWWRKNTIGSGHRQKARVQWQK